MWTSGGMGTKSSIHWAIETCSRPEALNFNMLYLPHPKVCMVFNPHVSKYYKTPSMLCPCITRTAGISKFWLMHRRREIKPLELARLQGFDADILEAERKTVQMTPNQLGGAIGNSVHVSMMRVLIDRLAVAAGLKYRL